jgi:hypothetical protein
VARAVSVWEDARRMDVAVRQRIAANEALFRQINERINQGHWQGEDNGIAFRCECARLGCNAMVSLNSEQYERVRANPRRFVLLPGHELLEHETVVERGDTYVVVEKLGEAGAIAEATDPR